MNRSLRRTILCLWTIVGTTGAAAQDGGRWFTGVGQLPDGTLSAAQDISADGKVVCGWVETPSTSQVFRWTRTGGLVGLGAPKDYSRSISIGGISADGSTIVGIAVTPALNSDRGAVWSASAGWATTGKLAGDAFSEAYDCTADGSAVFGISCGPSFNRAFKWTRQGGIKALFGGEPSSLTAVSASGAAIVARTQSRGLGVYWDDRRVEPITLQSGQTWAHGYDISADGLTVAGVVQRGRDYFAMRWTASTGIVELPALTAAGGGAALGVSADGSIIVGVAPNGQFDEAVLWTANGEIRSIKDLLGPTLPTGWTLRVAEAVSADGLTITGFGHHDGQLEGFVAHIPAPASMVALAVFALMARRYR